MRIDRVDVTLTKIPTRRPHAMNIGTTTHQELVLVRVRTDDGLEGVGEVPHMVGHSLKGESPGTVMVMLREKLIPRVLGLDPREIEAIQRAMDTVPWNLRAKSGINLACYDILGKALGVPVYRLLGGKVRDRVPLSWSIPITEFEAGVREAEEMVARGWRIIKVKTGRPNPHDDVEMVRRIREALGDGVSVRADANQAYDVKTAIRVTNAMARYDLTFMEQPVAWWDLDGLAEVSAAVTVPIMADESCTTPLDAIAIVKRRAAQILSIYISSPGGLLVSKKIATVAEAAGLAAYVGGALESPIGTAAALHFAASTPVITYGCEQGGQFLLSDDLAAEPIAFRDGALMVPDAPGLGVTLDWDKVAHYTVETFSVGPS